MGVNIDYQALNSVINYVSDYGNNLARRIATEARDNLAREYHESVALFYHQYTPKYYYRQFRLYEGCKKYYHNQHGNVFTGGIILTHEPLGSDYETHPEEVYNMSLRGFHGNYDIHTTPTIYDRMIRYSELLFDTIEYFV